MEVTLAVQPPASPSAVLLHYRRMNQAERYEVAGMTLRDGIFRSTIPGGYTNSRFALQYYFELKQGGDKASLYPGLGPDLANQPYFVVSKVDRG
ncbi:MAG: hypothetical protein EHM24_21855 [Acidobacteria bacterium]|nr:MAG: hypothetical protein EHM24_21855 [Acidobacteriota bacterium]